MTDLETVPVSKLGFLKQMVDEQVAREGANSSFMIRAVLLRAILTSEPSEAMVERAAQVHCDHYRGKGWWNTVSDEQKNDFRGSMRAALSAALGGGER